MSNDDKSATSVSRLLRAWNDGDGTARDKLVPLVYRELRVMARQRLRRERTNLSLESSDLVNEAYLRLVQQRAPGWQHRAHFFAIAATIMRRILIDRARKGLYQKRGGGAVRVPLDEHEIGAPARPQDLVALDEALQQLEQLDRRKALVVELRYFGGLRTEEIASHLGVSPSTVMRDWAFARSWLHRTLNALESGG